MADLRKLIVEVLVMAVAASACSLYGENYRVGDDSNWTIPPSPDFYANWSSSYFFKIGDSLYFEFESNRYNVIQVSKQEYDSCSACDPFGVFSISPTIFALNHNSIFYFISNISNYCHLGLKVSITVHNCAAKSKPISPPPLIPISSSSPAPSPSSKVTSPATAPSVNGFSPQPNDPAEKSMARFGADSINGLVISFILQLSFMISSILG